MTKSDLIENLSAKYQHLSAKEVEAAIREILEQMANTLQSGDRIEIRGWQACITGLPGSAVIPRLARRLNCSASRFPTSSLVRS